MNTEKTQFSMAEIIGILMAQMTIIQVELQVSSEYDGISTERSKELSDKLKSQIQRAEELWENRAS